MSFLIPVQIFPLFLPDLYLTVHLSRRSRRHAFAKYQQHRWFDGPTFSLCTCYLGQCSWFQDILRANSKRRNETGPKSANPPWPWTEQHSAQWTICHLLLSWSCLTSHKLDPPLFCDYWPWRQYCQWLAISVFCPDYTKLDQVQGTGEFLAAWHRGKLHTGHAHEASCKYCRDQSSNLFIVVGTALVTF